MQHKNLLILLVAFILISGAVVAGLFGQSPTARVSNVEISSLNLSSLGLTITLETMSSYPVAVNLRSVTYAIDYQGKNGITSLGTGEKTGLMLQPGKGNLTIPVTISNPSLISSAWQTLQSGEIRLMVHGKITPDFFGIAPSIPFSREITVPVPITTEKILGTIGDLAGALLQKVTT